MSSQRTKRRRIANEVESMLIEIANYSSSSSSSDEDTEVDQSTEYISDNCVELYDTTSYVYPCNQNPIDTLPLGTQIAEWSFKFNVSQNALSSLLGILRPVLSDSHQLPKDPRTLLKTPKSISVSDIDGGKFYYFGIRKHLIIETEKGFVRCRFPLVEKLYESMGSNLLTLSVGSDGFPVSRSSNVQMWPILIKVDQSLLPRPLLVAIFCGLTKPNNVNEFFGPFIAELKQLETDGFLKNNAIHNVRISCIIADAPARSFIKCVKGHNAYHSCERCEVEGDWEGRVMLTDLQATERLDSDFKIFKDPDHHVGSSPFASLDIGLVSQVVLDYMHLVCLGVMRKLLMAWISGPLPNRLPSRKVSLVSANLLTISRLMPEEFARRPRSLHEIKKFKATEFRQFLLYTGPVVLKNVLSKKLYQHFMLLHSAIYILLSDNASIPNWNQLARSCLIKFVKLTEKFYGSTFLIYNVHNLIHLADDAKQFGSLDNVSAFAFENYLQILKKMIRGQKLQLEQVVNRVSEIENSTLGSRLWIPSAKKYGAIKPKKGRCKKFIHESFIITNKHGDNCFMSNDGSILLIQDILCDLEFPVLQCVKFLDIQDVPGYPCSSAILNIFKLGPAKSNVLYVPIASLKYKCVLLPICTVDYVCITMLKSN